MKKAVLILEDIPYSCLECPLCRRECVNEYLELYEDECMFSDEDITDECWSERPNWCPLTIIKDYEVTKDDD